MTYYIGSTGQPQFHYLLGRGLYNIGMMLYPRSWRTPFCAYVCDNGVYPAFLRGQAWDEQMHQEFVLMLDKLAEQIPPEWVLLPDAVGDWHRTLVLAREYLPILRERELRIAIALQDGCDFRQVLSLQPEWVFVGGTTEWKLAHIHAAVEFFHPHGIYVHVGRVNTRRRLVLCQSANVDSVDGTTLNKYAVKTAAIIKSTLDQNCLEI